MLERRDDLIDEVSRWLEDAEDRVRERAGACNIGELMERVPALEQRSFRLLVSEAGPLLGLSDKDADTILIVTRSMTYLRSAERD